MSCGWMSVMYVDVSVVHCVVLYPSLPLHVSGHPSPHPLLQRKKKKKDADKQPYTYAEVTRGVNQKSGEANSKVPTRHVRMTEKNSCSYPRTSTRHSQI